jgi:hypothetical protein
MGTAVSTPSLQSRPTPGLAYKPRTKQKSDSLASGLGWFSVGLGLAQLAVPHKVAELVGVEPDENTIRLMRSLGMRELTSGVGILTQPKPAGWVQSRVVGDLMDLALLGAAMTRDKNSRGRTLAATVAVLGVAGLDLMCSRQLTKERSQIKEQSEPVGEKRVVRCVTINAEPAEVERAWSDWFWSNARDEARDANVQFKAAPGGRGTEVKAEFTYTPKAGKIGTAVARMTHNAPAQELGLDLRHFKQVVETGEIVISDATVRPGMHPAQPEPASAEAGQ